MSEQRPLGRYQFSLRTLVVFLAVATVSTGVCMHLLSGGDPGQLRLKIARAAQAADAATVEDLLRRRADFVNAPSFELPPLHWALVRDGTAGAVMLRGEMPAGGAAAPGPPDQDESARRLAVVKVLLERGADPFFKSPSGSTAADLADETGFSEIAALLRQRERGAAAGTEQGASAGE